MFIPTIGAIPGFVSRPMLEDPDGVLAAMSVLESKSGGEESVGKAALSTRNHLALVATAPAEATTAELDVFGMAREEVEAGV